MEAVVVIAVVGPASRPSQSSVVCRLRLSRSLSRLLPISSRQNGVVWVVGGDVCPSPNSLVSGGVLFIFPRTDPPATAIHTPTYGGTYGGQII